MGIDLVVTSLSSDWSCYANSALPLLASIDRLVPFGEPRPPCDRDFQDAAFRPASRWEWGHRARVAAAVRDFQSALSIRFDRTIRWVDPGELKEEYLGQLDVRASLALHDYVRRAGAERFPNLAELDIANLYLPVELPTVLVGQPGTIGSAPMLRGEIEAVRALVGEDERILDHLDMLEEACERAIASRAVILVDG